MTTKDISWLKGKASTTTSSLRPPWITSPALVKLDELLEGGIERVQELSSVALHRLINEIGLYDAGALLELASTDQVKEVFDLQVWTHDRINRNELIDWMAALIRIENDQVKASHLRGLDVELIAFMLKSQSKVYLNQEDEPMPDEPDGVFYKTPDNWFVIDLIAETETEAEQIIEIIDGLYVHDQDWSRSLLQNIMWELPSELEEFALRWRNNRLEDLGFADPLDAMVIYAPIDPDTIHIFEGTKDQPLANDPQPIGDPSHHLTKLLDDARDTSFWSKVISSIDEESKSNLLASMMYLANRTLAADRILPTQIEEVEESLNRLRGRLSLGLEYLCEGSIDKAKTALNKVALLRIARLGHTLTIKRAKPLHTYWRDGRFGSKRRRLNHLPAQLKRQLKLLLSPRPLFAKDEPPIPFSSLEQLDDATQWINEALLMADLCPKEIWPNTLSDQTTLPHIFCTHVIAQWLNVDIPLRSNAIEKLRTHLKAHSHFDEAFADIIRTTIDERIVEPKQNEAIQLVGSWFNSLAEDLMSINDATIDTRFIEGLIVETSDKTP